VFCGVQEYYAGKLFTSIVGSMSEGDRKKGLKDGGVLVCGRD
jgi:hypothetical protein